jgi:hypothetical protein
MGSATRPFVTIPSPVAKAATGGYPRDSQPSEVPAISLMRRLLRRDAAAVPDERIADRTFVEADPIEAPQEPPASTPAPPLEPEPESGVACPSCGYLIDPPPTRGRRCPACRQPIVVRTIEGRPAYLTEAAVEVFVAARRQDAEMAAQDLERKRWLRLAATVEGPSARRSKLAVAAPSAKVVEEARRMYLAAAERAVTKARREKRWAEVARIRREQAAAIFAAAGSPVPPPEDAAALHREGMLAQLRSFAAQGSDAELVSAGCCKACRVDDGKVFRIALELREARLPHAGCSKGICGCDWWIGVVEPKKRRRRKVRPAAG